MTETNNPTKETFSTFLLGTLVLLLIAIFIASLLAMANNTHQSQYLYAIFFGAISYMALTLIYEIVPESDEQ